MQNIDYISKFVYSIIDRQTDIQSASLYSSYFENKPGKKNIEMKPHVYYFFFFLDFVILIKFNFYFFSIKFRVLNKKWVSV